MIRLLLAFFLTQFSPSRAQNHPLYTDIDTDFARATISIAQNSDLAWDIVESLTTEVGARPAGSPADAKAVQWAVAKLNTMGFDRVWTEPVTVRPWKRGPANAKIISPYEQNISIAALGNSISTPSSGITAEIAFYENFNELKTDTSSKASGKIAFINGKTRRSLDGSGYGESVQGRFRGAVEAAKRGAVALIIRSAGTDSDRLPHTGTMSYENNVPKIPAVATTGPDADLIAHMHKRKMPITISITTENSLLPEAQSFNVLAELRGGELPDQIVAIGGHLDSWDLGTGAVDDGAGIAITMATMKIIRDLAAKNKLKPKRTLRLILFANEENGVDGGREYARVHGGEFHQLVSESDLGSGPIYKLDTNVKAQGLPWLLELKPLYASLNIEMGNNDGGTGADFEDVVEQKGYAQASLEQDASKYFDYHHSANDTLDKIDPADLRQNVAAWTALVWFASQAGVTF